MTLPETGSKRKLLDAAEELFADKGFEAVSVRDITQLAKTNVAAVNYHFGSREGLLTLVMLRYMIPVTEERLARLDEAEAKFGEELPLEEIIDAFVRPLASQVQKSDLTEKLFYKLIGRIFAQQGDGMPPQIEDQLRRTSERFSVAFAKALPGVPPCDLAWKKHFLVGGMIHMLTHREVLFRLSGGASGNPTMDETLARFIRYSSAGLREGLDNAPAGPVLSAKAQEPMAEPEKFIAEVEVPQIPVPAAVKEPEKVGSEEADPMEAFEEQHPEEEDAVPPQPEPEPVAAPKAAKAEKKEKEEEAPVKKSPQGLFDF